ncbi:hypothetical protein [Saccharophagus degradans]|uniref:Uncharacterized protein n=1 Tax=Saccharophagus degradans TaxID=86304 RepID=A0AAW7X6K2_9GAMM|nr:hypothetical protein [Saccharophagus degradans]MDO6423054.1 hypothetical protein [Saccharophagus degradans]MDO6607422.1 hypothetical protein [Saccharophagus degradans]
MFFVLDNEFEDGELWKLREMLDLLDAKISEVNRLIEKSSDPDSEGLCDRGEYFIGVGFVAIQQYLVETIINTGLSKSEAYNLGPEHSFGGTSVSLISSCANWWKHEPEWWGPRGIPKSGKATFERVSSVTDSHTYQLSNVLATFSEDKALSFIHVIPILEKWREDVYAVSKKA